MCQYCHKQESANVILVHKLNVYLSPTKVRCWDSTHMLQLMLGDDRTYCICPELFCQEVQQKKLLFIMPRDKQNEKQHTFMYLMSTCCLQGFPRTAFYQSCVPHWVAHVYTANPKVSSCSESKGNNSIPISQPFLSACLLTRSTLTTWSSTQQILKK